MISSVCFDQLMLVAVDASIHIGGVVLQLGNVPPILDGQKPFPTVGVAFVDGATVKMLFANVTKGGLGGREILILKFRALTALKCYSLFGIIYSFSNLGA